MNGSPVDLLLALAVVLVAAQVCGRLAERLGQPRVVGELLAGVALGPSVLGQISHRAESTLFATDVVSGVDAIAQLGLVLFMFLVGIDLDLGLLRGQGGRAGAISLTSTVVPLTLGAAVAIHLHPTLAADTSLAGFAGFVGVALSITAFPVLVRILDDIGLRRSRIGSLSLTCAAVDDVVAWAMLAALVGSVTAAGPSDLVVTAVGSVGFMVVVLTCVRPLLERLDRVPLAAAVALALAAAWTTDQIGVHAIFGAFMAGIAFPRSAAGRDRVRAHLEPLTREVLLPVFFAAVGLAVELGRLGGYTGLRAVALLLAAAIIGKVGGAAVAARATGESWRDALVLGVLMNTRGLTGLVILAVGLEVGIISETVFTVMVVVMLITTIMAAPLVRRLGGSQVSAAGV